MTRPTGEPGHLEIETKTLSHGRDSYSGSVIVRVGPLFVRRPLSPTSSLYPLVPETLTTGVLTGPRVYVLEEVGWWRRGPSVRTGGCGLTLGGTPVLHPLPVRPREEDFYTNRDQRFVVPTPIGREDEGPPHRRCVSPWY